MLSARTRPLSRGRAFRVRFHKPNARNGTQPEPRLRIILFTFETRHSVGERNGWKISSFKNSKLDLKFNITNIFRADDAKPSTIACSPIFSKCAEYIVGAHRKKFGDFFVVCIRVSEHEEAVCEARSDAGVRYGRSVKRIDVLIFIASKPVGDG